MLELKTALDTIVSSVVEPDNIKAWKDMTPEEQAEAKRLEEIEIKKYKEESYKKFCNNFHNDIIKYQKYHGKTLSDEFIKLLFDTTFIIHDSGPSGFSINYVYPFFEKTIKDMKPLEMLKDDEYGNMIREDVNNCFKLYKDYVETPAAIDEDVLDVKEFLFLFKSIIMHYPLIPINFRDKSGYSNDIDANYYQHKSLYSVIIDKEIGKPHYNEAIVFFEKYKDEEGKMQRSVFTAGGVAISKGNKLCISSSAYIKQKEYIHRFLKTGNTVPPIFYIEVVKDENGNEYIKNINDLKKVKKFYNLRYRVW